MIKVSINSDERQELEQFRRLSSSKDSEKALMILLCSEGHNVNHIAGTLKRNPHTIRDWIKRYKNSGIKGLSRNYSPGRPDEKRSKIKAHIAEIINRSPVDCGYNDQVWSVPLLAHDSTSKLNISVSNVTVNRALNAMGYSYKRPSKTVPARAPSKEEKKLKIDAMAAEIKSLLSDSDTEIYALDESHFSTEPYLVRGWFKKRWPPQDRNEQQTRKSHILWMLESHDKKILLEEIKAI
ncbi:MAG: IS630 family transposase [Desulfocapsa sp.]|nr:IS630 family transposase [Desulfocapsa sp.]MBU3946427.1 IS630 family transposase [Pseudomonadota bacterium]MBU3984885.1 IS630 family transposase [Pseudomonadota bacterium]MBU4396405.1 IS630 family transposase [Pseudomonadota bacterium]MCG2743380.1 IS630 family transposase [Desulfobacteraceae bacterium]